jgi:hypothetical protein
VSAPGDYDNGEIGGMIGKGNRSTRRKPAPVPLCPPQTPHAARTRTQAAAVGSQRLTAELRHGHLLCSDSVSIIWNRLYSDGVRYLWPTARICSKLYVCRQSRYEELRT